MKQTYHFFKTYKNQLFVGLLLILIIAFMAIFIDVLTDLQEDELRQFDHRAIAYMQGHVTDNLTGIMKAITFFGGKVWIISAVLIASLLVGFKKKRYALFLLFASGLGSLFNIALKEFIQRQRPDIYPIIQESGYSFPSGHSMGSIIFYGSLVIILAKISRRKWLDAVFILFFIVLVPAIGISRIYLGVHYPSDIIGGFSAGAFWLLICWLIFHFYESWFDKRADKQNIHKS
ncbi:phosphatase PAP2 family protein [Bacillus sp. 1P06AnD]|uniref:phosphatase PAP2 family protein n=1 Tax=Bacillus sp. 1P06AnD TaxID=3132208 RepID=UPI0039A03DE3